MGQIKEQMNYPIIVDARNMLDAQAIRALGFEYAGIGRP
jgi:hypothetical protein